MSDRLDEILFKLRTFREVEHNDNQWSTEFVYSLDKAKQALQSYTTNKIIEELEKVFDNPEWEDKKVGEVPSYAVLDYLTGRLEALNHRKDD